VLFTHMTEHRLGVVQHLLADTDFASEGSVHLQGVHLALDICIIELAGKFMSPDLVLLLVLLVVVFRCNFYGLALIVHLHGVYIGREGFLAGQRVIREVL